MDRRRLLRLAFPLLIALSAAAGAERYTVRPGEWTPLPPHPDPINRRSVIAPGPVFPVPHLPVP